MRLQTGNYKFLHSEMSLNGVSYFDDLLR